MSEFWAWNPFSVGVKKNRNALGNTHKVLTEAKRLRAASPLATLDSISFAGEVVNEALEQSQGIYSTKIIVSLMIVVEDFYHQEALADLDEDALSVRANSRDGLAVREYLRRQIRFLNDYNVNMSELRAHLVLACRYLLNQIPEHARAGNADDAFLSLRFSDLLNDPTDVVDTIVRSSFDQDLRHLGLLDPLEYRLEANIMRHSKIDPRQPPSNIHRYIMPSDAKSLDTEELIDTYLIGTPYRSFFNTELPLSISDNARFEHTHILGGTGHGKTQFIQRFLAKDIETAMSEKRSVVVIDSQGDMIRNISRLDCFNPQTGALRDKIVIIDPADILYPPAINMFSLDEKRMASYGPVEREKVQNSAIALYEHFFGELLGAELTAKQGVVFKYLARLMLEIPGATILTLRDLMDDPEPFIPYMEKLTGSARVFFAREFLDRSFNQTKKQISKRLWGVLSTPAFERLFSATENKIDLFSKMNDGSVILINTAKDLLKQDGASLYGRFFISMIGQAVMERAVLPQHERTPTFLYIDECQDYFDETIELLLAQGRKYKVGVTLSHQHFDQLTTSERASVLANTSIKACGGLNAKDAKILAQEMRVSSDYLQSMKKSEWDTEFALSIKHELPQAVKVTIPFGHLEQQPRMDNFLFESLITENRNKYAWEYVSADTAVDFSFRRTKKVERAAPDLSPTDIERPVVERPTVSIPSELPKEIAAEEAPEPIVRGKGGKQHTYLQNLISHLATEQGWRTEIEYPVLDGAGQIDVALLRADHLIACEISITTPPAHELLNIQKCLQAGANEVWVIAEKKSKLTTLESMSKGVAGLDISNLTFLLPDEIPAELEARSASISDDEQTVRGYRVKINRSVGNVKEAEERRDRIIRTLAKAV